MILTTIHPLIHTFFDFTYCVPRSFSLLSCIGFILYSCYRWSRGVTILQLQVSIQQLISRVVWGQTYNIGPCCICGLVRKQLHTVLVYTAVILLTLYNKLKPILQSSLNRTDLHVTLQLYLALDSYIFLHIKTDIKWYKCTWSLMYMYL